MMYVGREMPRVTVRSYETDYPPTRLLARSVELRLERGSLQCGLGLPRTEPGYLLD